MKSPDTAFGPTPSVQVGAGAHTSLAAIVAAIKQVEPRALTTPEMPDVITIIEYARDEVLALHGRHEALALELQQREQELARRERDVTIRQRALGLVHGKTFMRRVFGR